jgi:dCMP deaminase
MMATPALAPMRRSRDQMLMMMAEAASGRSTCNRLHVGAVIAIDGRVISTGYNGAPQGMAHCNHYPGDERPCNNAVHAEMNTIIFAARHGTAIEGGELFCTHEPCRLCAVMIINSGIRRVVFMHPYSSLTGTGLDLLNEMGIATMRLGYVEP